jgi:FSR family fosmidomycin resistance protein-like MFS transporter
MSTNLKDPAGSAASKISEQNGIINRWGGKLALFFTYTHFSHDLATGLLVALLPFIREDLGLNYLQAGFLISAFSITSGLSQFVGGWLSDRLGKQKAIALGLGGIGISAVVIGFASSYYMLLGTLVAMGILAGFYHPSAVSTLTNIFIGNRGRVISLHMLGGSLGFGIGPLIGALIASKFDWHLAFIILGLPALIALMLVLTKLQLPKQVNPKESLTQVQVSNTKPPGIWQVLRSAASIMSISIAMQLVTGPIMSFTPLFLVDVHNLSPAASSMWISVIRMGGLAGSIFGGWLTDNWGRKRAIFLALIIFGPVVLLLTKLPFGIALTAIFILFGWLMSMRETTMQTYLMDSTPQKIQATVFGIYFGFGQQGSSIIQPVVGDFMDTFGINSVFNTIALISIGLSSVAVIAACRIARRAKVQFKGIR